VFLCERNLYDSRVRGTLRKKKHLLQPFILYFIANVDVQSMLNVPGSIVAKS